MTGPIDRQVPGPSAQGPSEDAALAPFFKAARATAPAPSPALMARIGADAARVARRASPMPARPAQHTAPRGLRALWAALTAPLGGGIAGGVGAGGLALAAATGLWLGATGPEALLDLEDRLFAPVLVIELGNDWALLAEL